MRSDGRERRQVSIGSGGRKKKGNDDGSIEQKEQEGLSHFHGKFAVSIIVKLLLSSP
jgi:hypothetical protein